MLNPLNYETIYQLLTTTFGKNINSTLNVIDSKFKKEDLLLKYVFIFG